MWKRKFSILGHSRYPRIQISHYVCRNIWIYWLYMYNSSKIIDSWHKDHSCTPPILTLYDLWYFTTCMTFFPNRINFEGMIKYLFLDCMAILIKYTKSFKKTNTILTTCFRCDSNNTPTLKSLHSLTLPIVNSFEPIKKSEVLESFVNLNLMNHLNAYHPPMALQVQLQLLLHLQTCSYKEKQNQGLECKNLSDNNLNVHIYFPLVSTHS